LETFPPDPAAGAGEDLAARGDPADPLAAFFADSSPVGGTAARSVTSGFSLSPFTFAAARFAAATSANTTSAEPFFFFPSRITTSSTTSPCLEKSSLSLATG
jgi:hypothetical protein